MNGHDGLIFQNYFSEKIVPVVPHRKKFLAALFGKNSNPVL
jgi:hypothetical protein